MSKYRPNSGSYRLDRRIELQSLTVTTGAAGDSIKAWTTYATVSAQAIYPTAGLLETVDSGLETAANTVDFIIRYNSSVSPKHLIVYDGCEYDIIGSPMHLDRKKYMRVRTKLRI